MCHILTLGNVSTEIPLWLVQIIPPVKEKKKRNSLLSPKGIRGDSWMRWFSFQFVAFFFFLPFFSWRPLTALQSTLSIRAE